MWDIPWGKTATEPTKFQGEGHRPTSQRQKYQGGFWHYQSLLQFPILWVPFHNFSYPRKIILLITLAQNTGSNLHCSQFSLIAHLRKILLAIPSKYIHTLSTDYYPTLWSWHKMSTSVFLTIEEISYSLTVALGVCVWEKDNFWQCYWSVNATRRCRFRTQEEEFSTFITFYFIISKVVNTHS